MSLTPNQEYRDINFLIQHIKKGDPHLYEALNITDANIKKLVDTLNNPVPPKPVATPTIYHVFNFGLAQAGDLVVATEPTSYLTCEHPNGIQLTRWRIRANVAPVGANIVIDILRQGSSIFVAGNANKIVLNAGSLRMKKENAFLTNPYKVLFDDELVPQVIQTGTTVKGFKIHIQLFGIVL